jgi:TPR repeat protein
MATRDLIRIRGMARRGDAAAQMELGRLYLSGAPGHAPSLSAALIWLERAARQGLDGASELIGRRIPATMARVHADPHFMLRCYHQATDAGCTTAPRTLTQWLLGPPPYPDDAAALERVGKWVRMMADSGDASAVALLAEALASGRLPTWHAEEVSHYQQLMAATNQSTNASSERATMLALVHKLDLAPEEAQYLFQYYLNAQSTAPNFDDAIQALHRAARQGIAQAQYSYGLWLGKVDQEGQRLPLSRSDGIPKVGPAVVWLRLAAEQSYADAWFVLAMLHRNARFACHDHAQYLYCLHRAAQLGCARAQTYLGRRLWRSRRAGISHWLEAAYWLWRAAKAGDEEALTLLPKTMGHAPTMTPWDPLVHYLDNQPHAQVALELGIRLRLAAAFGLNTSEMLYASPHGGQHEHCLMVEVGPQDHHIPRLIAIETDAQRKCARRFAGLAQLAPAHDVDGARESMHQALTALVQAAHEDGVFVVLSDRSDHHSKT